MFKNKDKVMAQVANMAQGEFSDSDRYWCVTCKMLFDINKPVCPYMTKICINTPIPVELVPPETTGSIEQFGLFYPKVPQEIMAYLMPSDSAAIGEALAHAYMDFVKDWRFPYESEPLQTLKSFIVIASGCETGQRVRKGETTFIITDRQRIWSDEDRDKLLNMLNAGVEVLKEELGVEAKITFDEINITGEMPSGKYYCPMCRKFFEFAIQRKTITCPIMAQKCMATPMAIEMAKSNYSLMDLQVVYDHTPDIYRRLMAVFPDPERGAPYLRKLLEEEWLFTIEEAPLAVITDRLGLGGGATT